MVTFENIYTLQRNDSLIKETHVIVIKVAVHLELVQSYSSLEGVNEGALRDPGVGPDADGYFWAPLLGETRV